MKLYNSKFPNNRISIYYWGILYYYLKNGFLDDFN